MQLQITQELQDICKQIIAEQRDDASWAKIESDDLLQSESFTGGYDATERAFCFSYYAPDGAESWFQITLEEVDRIARGVVSTVDLRPAE